MLRVRRVSSILRSLCCSLTLTSFLTGLRRALDDVEVVREFAAGGRLPSLPNPGLAVAGLPGVVALPLQPFQAEQLIAVCSKAPFGRGSATVHDDSVRRTWQLAPSQFVLRNPAWATAVEAAKDRACERLGISLPAKQVTAEARQAPLLFLPIAHHPSPLPFSALHTRQSTDASVYLSVCPWCPCSTS